jgi:uncharacterized membrane protein
MREKRTPPWKDGRTFGFTMGIVLGLFGGLMWMSAYNAAVSDEMTRASRHSRFAVVAWGVAVVLALLAVAAPQWLTPVNKAWMALAEAIGFVMSRVVLGITYFVVLTPIALVMRRRGFDPLRPRFDPDRESYWEQRDPKTFDEQRYDKQY